MKFCTSSVAIAVCAALFPAVAHAHNGPHEGPGTLAHGLHMLLEHPDLGGLGGLGGLLLLALIAAVFALTRRHTAKLLVLAGALLLSWPDGISRANDDAQLSEDAVEGMKIAQTNCAKCHAIAGETSSPHPDAPKFRNVIRNWPANALEESLGEGIVTGHPDMPEFKFTPGEIAAFVAYLQTLAPDQ